MDIQKLHTDQQLRDHVVEQLLSVGGVHKGEDIAILCPFHDDTKPSLNVHVGHKLTPGKFNCFACPAKGSWNKLAHALKLVPVKGSQERNQHKDKSVVVLKDDDEVDPFKLMLSALQTNETYKEYEPPTLTGTEDLPDDFSWRGYPRRLYNKLGAGYYWTEHTQSLYFPLKVDGVYQGYTLCTVASTGTKFKKYLIHAEAKRNLFLYDQLRAGEPIVLCEGHFDAIRLMGEGFNATAIFGVQNWSDFKRNLVIAKNPPRVVIAFDGDQPGYTASVDIFNSFRNVVDVDIFYLPLKEEKLDPGNMPEEYLTLLREKTYGGS